MRHDKISAFDREEVDASSIWSPATADIRGTIARPVQTSFWPEPCDDSLLKLEHDLLERLLALLVRQALVEHITDRAPQEASSDSQA